MVVAMNNSLALRLAANNLPAFGASRSLQMQ